MSFIFLQPHSLAEALEALNEHGSEAKVLAGGTALVLMLQQRLVAPQALISLERILDLGYERFSSDGLHLGAMVRLRDIERSQKIKSRFPGMSAACQEVGNVRVRNQATLGGNLAEADYASDPPAMLLALDARLTAQSRETERTIPLSEFFFGFYTTALQENEILTDIRIPLMPEGTRSTYVKFKSRSMEDRPCVGVAAVAIFSGEVCMDLRVAVGAACEIPRRFSEFENLARGERLSDELIAGVAEGYAQNIDTIDDLRGSAWYRKQMVRVHVQRALDEVRNGHR